MLSDLALLFYDCLQISNFGPADRLLVELGVGKKGKRKNPNNKLSSFLRNFSKLPIFVFLEEGTSHIPVLEPKEKFMLQNSSYDPWPGVSED